jgi:hypothetical protein
MLKQRFYFCSGKFALSAGSARESHGRHNKKRKMKHTISLIVALFIFAVPAQVFAAAGTLDEIPLPPNATLNLEAYGVVKVVGDTSQTLRIVADLSGPDGRTVAKKKVYALEKTVMGARLKIFANKNLPAGVKVLVPADTQIILESKAGSVILESLSGSVSGVIKKAALSVSRHRGALDLKMKSGLLAITDFAGEGKNVTVNAVEGKITASVASVAPGAGSIKIEKGDVKLTIARKTKIAVDAAVIENGRVTTNLSIERPDPKSLYFTANGGKLPWDIEVKNGDISVVLPEP